MKKVLKIIGLIAGIIVVFGAAILSRYYAPIFNSGMDKFQKNTNRDISDLEDRMDDLEDFKEAYCWEHEYADACL